MSIKLIPWVRGALGILVLGCCSSACVGPQRDWPDDLIWSPDGKHAAVLRLGFRVSDADGNLSAQLDDRVYRVAWLDSERVVLARTRTVGTFADVAAAVGRERTRAIVAQAEHAWTHSRFATPDASDFPDVRIEVPEKVLLLYLREHYGDVLREQSGEDWGQVEHTTADLHQLIVARVVGDRLELGTKLSEDVLPIKAIRPAPDRRSVAFVTRNEETWFDDTARIHLVPIDVLAQPRLVAENTGDFLDWSLDSRALLYFSESGSDPNIGRFGCLERRAVIDASGQIGQTNESLARCLSYVIFDRSSRAFSLPDGRVVFESMNVELPRELGGPNRLFTLTREPDKRHTSFDRFPVLPFISTDVLDRDQSIAFFDVSPDRMRVLFGTRTGDIRLLTLEDGRTELLPLGLHRAEGYVTRDLPQAVWSGPDAFTYLKRVGTRNEFILRRGSTETVLSRNWPKEMLWPYPEDPSTTKTVPGRSPSARRASSALR
ncbi:MAG TPA: hypothetical protein VH583_01830 [Vicinamibacterales bacterium]